MAASWLALGLALGLASGLASGLAGCGSDRPVAREAFFAERPNPGAEGAVPWGEPLTTATRAVPEQLVAFEAFQAVGVAISPSGRLFVSSPRWHGQHGSSVVELFPGTDKPPRAYPDQAWNNWSPGGDAGSAWVCVQALHRDGQGRIWALDPGAPGFLGPEPGAAKLVRFDLTGDVAGATYVFDQQAAPAGSYLNDVRIDAARGVAYVSDSGLGAIVALDLTTGRAARFLEDHASTKAEPGVRLTVGGEPWVDAGGSSPAVHCDGIALSPDGQTLYYQALTSRTLYSVPTAPMIAALRERGTDAGAVDAGVRDLGRTFATDAMIMDARGVLYFTAIERNAIAARLPSGELTLVTADERLVWPDSLDIHNGLLYVTASRINEVGLGNPEGPKAQGPFYVLRVPLVDPQG